MTGVDLEFKEIEGGRLWPPVVDAGVVSGYARVGGVQRVELFEVNDAGLSGPGISYLWSELDGISITDGLIQIHSDKYLSGGLRFALEGLSIRGANGNEVRQQDGYPVGYCLLNRITYEQQKLVDKFDVGI
ncbi:hypothetical protein GCM10008969_49230 [Pseudomonas veronii subsp. inensis]|uniref:hypothetical protein n=1 Tax=Pseudomonas veronii TaxID=76761 RepID=UPI0031F8079A